MDSNEEIIRNSLFFDSVIESGLSQAIINVLSFGAKKYSPDSWKTMQKDYGLACLRHLVKHISGEVYDPESKMLHIDHAITNLMFIRWKLKNEK